MGFCHYINVKYLKYFEADLQYNIEQQIPKCSSKNLSFFSLNLAFDSSTSLNQNLKGNIDRYMGILINDHMITLWAVVLPDLL